MEIAILHGPFEVFADERAFREHGSPGKVDRASFLVATSWRSFAQEAIASVFLS
jgi:hypothetical protein